MQLGKFWMGADLDLEADRVKCQSGGALNGIVIVGGRIRARAEALYWLRGRREDSVMMVQM